MKKKHEPLRAAAAFGLLVLGPGVGALALDTSPAWAALETQNFKIPPGPVATALRRFAEKSGTILVYDSELTRDKTTAGLEGAATINEGLARLLSGTGLSYTLAPGKKFVSIVLAQADNGARNDAGAEALPPIDVGAERRTPARPGAGGYGGAGPGQDPHDKTYVLQNASTGTKTDTPVMDTPLNIQSVTQQVMRDQQNITIEQVLRNVSGVTVGGGGAFGGGTPYEAITLRGFSSSIMFRNGFRMENGGNAIDGVSTLQLANVASVEVLKGPGATLYGLLEPGGVVNIVTKEPLNAPYYSIQQQIGSFANYRTTLDATGPVTDDREWLYRLNFSYQNNGAPFGSPIDLTHGEDVFVAPTLKWNYDDATWAKLEVQYDDSRTSVVSSATPTFNGVFLPVPRNRNYDERSPSRLRSFFTALTWSHQFDPDWSIKQQIAYKHAENYVDPFLVAFPNDTGTQVFADRLARHFDRAQTAFSVNTDILGHFETFGLQHTLLIGGDFYRSSAVTQGNFDLTSFSEIDIFNPVHPGTPIDGVFRPLVAAAYLRDTAGAYIQDQIKLPYDFQILAGVRYQTIRQTQATGQALYALQQDAQAVTGEAATPRFGLLWRPEKWVSFYGHYADGFGANAGQIYPGTAAPPTRAEEFEAGVKLELFDGRLRATADYFNLAKTNVPSTDYAHIGEGNYVVLTGEVRSKGVEVDIQGEILPGWSVIASYTNQEIRTTKSETPSEIGQRFGQDPRNLASLWTSYEFQADPLRGLKIGGGAVYRDAQPIFDLSGSGVSMNNPAYATINLMGSYRFELAGMKMTAQLNIENLADTTYYGQTAVLPNFPIYFFGYRLFGAPRTFLGSLRAEF